MLLATAVMAEREVIVAVTPLRKLSECCTEQCLGEFVRPSLHRSGLPSDSLLQSTRTAIEHQWPR